MTTDMVVPLSLVAMLLTLAWLWVAVARQLIAKGHSVFFAHFIGATAGPFVVLGVFILYVTIFMSNEPVDVSMAMVGVLILAPYLFIFWKTGAAQTAKIEELPSSSIVTPVREPRKTLKKWWQEEKRKAEQTLGMSFGNFFFERAEDHFWGWLILGFFILWFCLFLTLPSPDSWFVGLLGGFIVAAVVTTVYMFSCLLRVPLLRLPFTLLSLLSIACEALWRIRKGLPYTPPPPVPYTYQASYKTPPVQQQSSGSWIIPLIIGLWIGYSWGKDD
jgi:hypothetical protein